MSPPAGRDAPSPGPVVRVGRVPLVARAAEMRTIREALAEAFSGTPRALVFAGEAGIGKTRLLLEAAREAEHTTNGVRLLRGGCLDERGSPPFQPWIDALRSLPDDPVVADAFRDVLPRLTGSVTDGSPSGVVSAEQLRYRLYEEVTRAVAGLARRRPLLLEFDDLQWADAASSRLLGYLLRHLPAAPLLVVGAVRADELGANPDLRRMLDDLARLRLATLLTVAPIGPQGTDSLVAGLLSGNPDPGFVTAIHRRCEGNPFCVEEVVRSCVESGMRPEARDGMAWRDDLPVPRGVTAVVERRLRRLEPPARSAVEVAALIGREFSLAAVADATATGVEEATALLAEAAREGLLAQAGTAGGPTGFAFPHDRVRESVAELVDPARRVRLHGAIADALARRGDERDIRQVSMRLHHLRLGHRPEAAAVALDLAALASRGHAHAAAAAAYRTALDLGAAEPVPGLTRHVLLLRLGEAAMAAGDPAAAAVLREADEAARLAGDLRAVALARRRLGTLRARDEAFPAAAELLEEALSLLRCLAAQRPDESAEIQLEMAEVLVELAGIAGLSLGNYPMALSAAQEALSLGTRHRATSPAHAAHARLALAHATMRSGRLAEGARLLPEALDGALAANDANLAAEVSGAMANHGYWSADLDGSERAALRRRDLAAAAGDPWALRHAASWLAMLETTRGRWSSAAELLAEAEREISPLSSPEPRAFLRQIEALSLWLQGRSEEAVTVLEAAVAGFRPSGPGTLVWYIGCLATAAEAAGLSEQADRAAAETARILEGFPSPALPRAPALAQLGLLAAMRGDRSTARQRYRDLAPLAGQLHWLLTDRVLGMLAATVGDVPRADRHFARAAATAERGGLAPELALTLAERGFALLRGSDRPQRTEGEASLRRALDLLGSLGMERDRERVAAAVCAGAHPRERASTPGGLSRREAEVVVLLTQGATNREIAERLAISERTVATHLSHVFTKIGVENRAAAVAFALRHGIA